MAVSIIAVGAASDGKFTTPADKSYTRNDDAHLERVAQEWVRSEGRHERGVTYRLDHLPKGYSGWEKTRQNDSKHVDRYIYGHPNGVFRSAREVVPHFKHLKQHGTADGCQCGLCSGNSKNRGRKSGSNSIVSGSPGEQSRFFAGPSSAAGRIPAQATGNKKSKVRRYSSDSETQQRRKQVDQDGIPDYYRTIIDRVQAAGSDGTGYVDIYDILSPDWRAGHMMLQDLLSTWSESPNFMPRVGELVLFVRNLAADEGIAWDPKLPGLRRIDRKTGTWLNRPKWEVGVVTQLPVEPVTSDDLIGFPSHKKTNVAYSGFRVEPLPAVGSADKSATSQHTYVHLHATRPFFCWKECINGLDESEWHSTLQNALTVANSFCLVGKYCFKGTWPEATVFARGLYIGPEFIMVGDTVRLIPRENDHHHRDTVTDVMVISSIRLRFVNLDEANDDDYDEQRPYNTCLHVAGKAFTTDAKRSFDGIGASKATPGQDGLPLGLAKDRAWFHLADPSNDKSKLEVPYTRVLGKCFDESTLQKLFMTPGHLISGSQSQHQSYEPGSVKKADISLGLRAMRDARSRSKLIDQRIDTKSGKRWYWAETRIEQLDLHEVNGAFVGGKDEKRSKSQMTAWKKALKVLDGKRDALEEYQTARKQLEQQARESINVPSGAYGMMTSGAHVESATDVETGDADAMDLDEAAAANGEDMNDGLSLLKSDVMILD